ncbi:MAG: PIG-L family deacetylase [Chloroflexota bacterium]
MVEQAPLAIFLSPHFDDIALSCGGVAARLSRMGARCVGITVFAAPAPEGVSLSPYAVDMHDKWEKASGATVQAINDVRRDEERAALRLLNMEPVWLDFPDAPYRRGEDGHYFYTSDVDLFGKIAGEERRLLVPKIVAEIRRVVAEHGARGRVRVFAPLGVGHHVDHQLVFLAARRLGPRYGVLYYEDYPYAARPGALEARIAELGMPVQPRLTPVTDMIGLKIAAIARYKSQLDVLFGSSDEMAPAVRGYAQMVAQDAPLVQMAERTWSLPSSYTLG